jgi:hypothetical protein
MKSLSEILLEKLRVSKPVDNIADPIDEEYDNFIEKEWIDMKNRVSITYFKEVEIPNIFKLVLKKPDAWYNIIKFDIIFAYDYESGKTYRPKIMFTLDNDKSKSRQVKLFIDAERTRLANLNNIYDIEDFLKHDFYEEFKLDTVEDFISFITEAIKFYVNPSSKGNTMNITW